MGTLQNECSVSERTCAEEQLQTWAIDLTTGQPQYVLGRVAAALTSGTGESAEREGGPGLLQTSQGGSSLTTVDSGAGGF